MPERASGHAHSAGSAAEAEDEEVSYSTLEHYSFLFPGYCPKLFFMIFFMIDLFHARAPSPASPSPA